MNRPTVEALMRLVGDLDVESTRAIREEVDQETLVLPDLLKKPDLEKKGLLAARLSRDTI
jgi:hypothetical protein